jgi:hypothetical protein
MEPEAREGEIHEIVTLLPWYLNHTLSETERQRVEQHLADCDACQKEFEELSRLRMAVRTAHTARAEPAADLFQRVLARVETYEATQAMERRVQAAELRWWERSSAWLRSLFAPRWAPALATGLIVVQLIVIAGLLGFYYRRQHELLVTLPPLEEPIKPTRVREAREGYVNAYTFQSALRIDNELGSVVTEHSILGDQAVAFGFATKPAGVTAFLIGTLYAEALAYVRSDELDLAAQRVASLDEALHTKQALQPLSTYLRQLHTLLEGEQYPGEVLGHLLALFQPLYEAYASHQVPEQRTLFQIGAWLVNMNLAAASGDNILLKYDSQVNYFYNELQIINAPKGALDALRQLSQLVKQPDISNRDLREILKLVKKIQIILS